jgi:hypothetical protein
MLIVQKYNFLTIFVGTAFLSYAGDKVKCELLIGKIECKNKIMKGKQAYLLHTDHTTQTDKVGDHSDVRHSVSKL